MGIFGKKVGTIFGEIRYVTTYDGSAYIFDNGCLLLDTWEPNALALDHQDITLSYAQRLNVDYNSFQYTEGI
jgi:hypothetical protein